MNKKQKKMLTRIIIAAVLMIAFKVINTFVDIPTVVLFIMYMVPYLVIGYDILRKAIKGILNRQVFDENFLMAVATVGAIIIALVDDGDFTEAIAVMLFYQIGELFQNIAVGKSRKNISELMDIRPDYANVYEGDELVQVDPDDVETLEDLVISAVNEALRQQDKDYNDSMAKISGGVGLGGLPF